MSKQIDIILLTGFLGAGKTTVLNEIVRQFSDIKLGILVNDFGEVPVDGTLLKHENPEILEEGHKIYEIGNGSIFCTCLKAPFLYGLKYFEREAPDYLVIEASGLSDPSGMYKFLSEHKLDSAFRIKHVMALVDPLKYRALVHVLDVIVRQIQAADQLLLNKVDLASNELIQEIIEDLKIRSKAPVQKASFGEFDYSFIRETSSLESGWDKGALESCNTPETRPGNIFLNGSAPDKEELLSFLHKVEPLIYRLKGFIYIGETLFYVSDTGNGFSLNRADKSGIKSGLTVLCPLENEKEISRIWREFGVQNS